MRLFSILLLGLLPLPALADPIAILPVKLLDTSGELRDQSDDHQRRLSILSEAVSRELSDTVTITSAEVAACQLETTECLLALARDKGADQALFIVSQKASTLILQLFATLVDVDQGKLIVSREMNFRGDNDDAWRRAGRFLGRSLTEAP